MRNTSTYATAPLSSRRGVGGEVIPIPTDGLLGGSFVHNYQYDNLYRLNGANGEFKGEDSEQDYTLAMTYSPSGNILTKNQTHRKHEYGLLSAWEIQPKTAYNMAYEYADDKQPHAPIKIGDNSYTYDANGNQTGYTSDVSGQDRQILWDEENRIRAIAVNGNTHHYMYDAAGERVLKSTGDGQAVYVNGFPMGGSGTVGNYTMYVSPYVVVSNSKMTKHFYIEGQRIVSKVGEMGDIGEYEYYPETDSALFADIDWEAKNKDIKDQLIANFEALGLEGVVFVAGKSGKIPYGQLKKYYTNAVFGGTPVKNNNDSVSDMNKLETLQFFYHPDHLGSSSFITDVNGEAYQHYEYMPYGELFVEQKGGTDQYTPYLFNGKELDDKTGLYYYGARYLDPKTSIWLSVDPLADKYPNVSSYNYCLNNPVLYVDVNGEAPGDFFKNQDVAAQDWGLFYNDNSIRDNQEYGSTIYQTTNSAGETGYTYSVANVGTSGASVTCSPTPSGATATADIHSHAAYAAGYINNDFSGATSTSSGNLAATSGDIGDNNRTGLNGYVTTPNGSLQKYDATSGNITTLSTNMASDANDPTRLNTVSSAPTTSTYTIQRGDNLTSVANRYSTTVTAIAAENNIADINKISAGTTINITN